MARVFQRRGDKLWWLDYVDGSGKRHRIKTTTTSKQAAKDLLNDVVSELKRRKLGLEMLPTSAVKTVGEAWGMWLERWCPEASKSRELRRFKANVKDAWIADAKLAEVSGELLDRWFAECLKRQSASTVNGHRRILRCVYNTLSRKRLFRGVNPVKETRPLEQIEHAYEVLTEAEFKRLLPHVDGEWRDLFHLAFTTGLRRGELYALRKDRNVVDLERAVLTPRASNARQTTKGKKVKSIPLTPDAIEILRRAWEGVEWGGLLFPGVKGKLRSENLRPAQILRSAMVRAGMVDGWVHVCRRGCGTKERHSDEQQRKCPKCDAILWPKPIVRQVRFHDLRHSTANHLLDNGVDLSDVQLYLRHSTIAVTERYRHRTVEALRKAITAPSTSSLLQRLEALADGQPSEVVRILEEAREKLALVRHQPSNVVSITKVP